MIGSRYPFDDEDPFGSRPDEKPPTGWDANFWEGVRAKIEDQRHTPDAGRVPEPPRRRADIVSMAVIFAMLAGAAAVLLAGRPAEPIPSPEDAPSLTIVRVDGSAEPDVAVEWARSGGMKTGYVVLQSIDPDLSYVVIDRRLATR